MAVYSLGSSGGNMSVVDRAELERDKRHAQAKMREVIVPWVHANLRAPKAEDTVWADSWSRLTVEGMAQPNEPKKTRLRFYAFVWDAASEGHVDLDSTLGPLPWRTPTRRLSHTELAKLALFHGFWPSRWRRCVGTSGAWRVGEIVAEMAGLVKPLRIDDWALSRPHWMLQHDPKGEMLGSPWTLTSLFARFDSLLAAQGIRSASRVVPAETRLCSVPTSPLRSSEMAGATGRKR